MPGLKDELQEVLIHLNRSAPEIKSSAFVSLDGLMLARPCLAALMKTQSPL